MGTTLFIRIKWKLFHLYIRGGSAAQTMMMMLMMYGYVQFNCTQLTAQTVHFLSDVGA